MTRKILENNPKCPICECETIKYGTRNNIQRYRCKNKNKPHVFYDPNVERLEYQRNTKRILSLLLNMLENNFFNSNDLEEALNPKKNFYKFARKIYFNTKYLNNKNKEKFEIKCSNPKLLICQDNQSITFIQIPPCDFNKLNNQIEHENYLNPLNKKNEITKREINIIDDSALNGINLKYSCNNNIVPYMKNIE